MTLLLLLILTQTEVTNGLRETKGDTISTTYSGHIGGEQRKGENTISYYLFLSSWRRRQTDDRGDQVSGDEEGGKFMTRHTHTICNTI